MKKIILMMCVLLTIVGATMAQSPMPKPTTTPATKTVKTAKPPKEPKMAKVMPKDDTGIKTCIDGKLAKSKMATEGFQASVSSAVATFTGSTKVPGHKGGVSGIGESCGAKSIVNNITIEGKPAKVPKPKTPKMTNPPKTQK